MVQKKWSAALVASVLCWNSSYAALAPVHPNARSVEISAEALLGQTQGLRGQMTQSLEDEKVKVELAKLGVTPSEVRARLAAMSDQELQQVKDGVQRQAGGDVVVLSVTTLLIIIIVILLIK